MSSSNKKHSKFTTPPPHAFKRPGSIMRQPLRETPDFEKKEFFNNNSHHHNRFRDHLRKLINFKEEEYSSLSTNLNQSKSTSFKEKGK